MGQDHPPAGVGKPDGELADGEILDVRQLVIGFVLVGEEPPGPHQEALPCVGQGQGRGPVEKRDAELPLHVGDVVAQGLLGYEEALGGFGKIQLLRRHDEVF